MKTKIFVFLFEAYSDWEISYLTPEINKNQRFDLYYFSIDGKPVKSMGGLNVSPNFSLAEITAEEIGLLILPGGELWEKEKVNEIEKLVREVNNRQNSIAAICAATSFLGNKGFLNKVKHTSNDLNYLKSIAPEYKGEENYQNVLAVTDKNIITANGIAPIEFAREVFKKINLYDDEALEKWFQLFKNGIWS